MKRIKYSLLAALALAAFTVSCVEPLEPVPSTRNNGLIGEGLCFTPFIEGMPIITKAYNINDEKGGSLHDESIINTLDIFVYWEKPIEGGGVETKYFTKYHLPKTGNSPIQSGETYQLETNWDISYTVDGEAVSYKGNSFRVYVLANLATNVRESDLPVKPTEGELKALISTSKISHPVRYGNACYDIVRLANGVEADFPESPNAEDDRWRNPHIQTNTFLMDGVVTGWTPRKTGEAYDNQQFFNNAVATHTDEGSGSTTTNYIFNLSRAAAKFIVKLDLSPSFMLELGRREDNTNKFIKEETKDGVKTVVETTVGEAWYKFANFAKSTYDFTPSANNANTLGESSRWDSQDFYRFSSVYNYDDEGHLTFNSLYPFEDITYSYAFGWEQADAAEKAPALAVSIVYSTTTKKYNSSNILLEEETEEETNYYRIPLVNVTGAGGSSVATSIERNNCYVVNALINSKGATIEDIIPTNVNLTYKVIPWPAQIDQETSVDATQLLYFVAETQYTLRGEENQTVDLQYFTPKSDIVGGHYLYEPKITRVRVYYRPDESNERNLQNATNLQVYEWTGNTSTEHVVLTIDHQSNGGGKVTIISDALKSRAVKYIEFDLEVAFSSTNKKKQTIKIEHFPLDNIQSIQGKWSSRWNGAYEGGTRTGDEEWAYTPPEGWDRYEIDGTRNVNCTYDEYIDAIQNGIDNGSNAEIRNYLSNYNSSQLRNMFGTSDTQDIINNFYSIENANKSGNYYYWIEEDYYGYYVVWRASTFYRTQTHYYKSTNGYPGTGTWAAYSPQKSGINEDSYFEAKVLYNGNTTTIRRLATDGSISNQSGGVAGNNTHMYIIQISKADPSVVLGRPNIVNNQSPDNVVSPAFMIASQLGAVSSSSFTSGKQAADHCAGYMEVADNGRRYANWRLPTKSEIAYIAGYQNNQNIQGQGVFTYVLTGQNYYTLDGGTAPSNYPYDTWDTANYVRCIRDLTPAEVAELNKIHNITPASY